MNTTQTGILLYKALIMPPTSKKLEGHIASGTFVGVCIRVLLRLSVTLFDA